MNFASRSALAVAIALALGALTVAGPTLAQDSKAGRARDMAAELQKRFAAADKNGDGRLTKEEAQAGMPMVYKHFDEIDKSHAGSISLTDIAAFAKDKRGAKQAGG